MFSGIVEAQVLVLEIKKTPGLIRIQVGRPKEFDDVKPGDSISTNGVCLTIEFADQKSMTFALAAETLRVLKSNDEKFSFFKYKLNLERSLRFGDRIHGHLVTGHVESMGEIIQRRKDGDSLFLDVKVDESVLPYVWKKGSITLNGVSLTVNELNGNIIGVCLVPETQARTNLSDVQTGDLITVEPDYIARATVRNLELKK